MTDKFEEIDAHLKAALLSVDREAGRRIQQAREILEGLAPVKMICVGGSLSGQYRSCGDDESTFTVDKSNVYRWCEIEGVEFWKLTALSGEDAVRLLLSEYKPSEPQE